MSEMKIRFIDIIILLITTALLIFIYIGFYFPDNVILYQRGAQLVLFAIRFLFPFFIAGVIILYIGARTGKIKKSNVILLVLSIFISVLLVLFAGSIIFSLKNKMNEAIRQFHPYLQLKPHPIDTNALGDKNTFRIVCLGGSTTEFKDTKEVGWPEYLERQINQISGMKKVKVFNYGRQWYSTLHMLIHYETNIRPYRPNVIILMEAINDLLQNADQSYFSSGSFRNDYGHFNGPVNRIIKGRGFIKEFFGNKLSKLWYQKPRKVLELDSFPGLIPYERYLKTIIDLAKSDGTTVVLMTQPTLLKEKLSEKELSLMRMVNVETAGKVSRWSYASAWRGMSQYNDAVRLISKNLNVNLIDLEKVVPKNTEYFRDDVHFSDKAFPLIAKTVAGALIANGVIQRNYER